MGGKVILALDLALKEGAKDAVDALLKDEALLIFEDSNLSISE